MCSTSETSDVFNSRDEYIWYLPKQRNSVFTENKEIYFILTFFLASCNSSPTEKEVLKIQNRNYLANPNSFVAIYSSRSN